jgi:hypothetical protein
MAIERVVDQELTKFGAKADFIRSQPESMSAKEIVEAAAKQGMRVSVNHVYNLRAAAASKSVARAPSAATQLPRKLRVGRPPAIAAGENVEQKLRMAIAELGLVRAREVFDMIEAAFGNPRRYGS